jgi:putative hemolysin
MIALGLTGVLLLLFGLLLVRSCLNSLSAMDITRLAEEEGPMVAGVKAFKDRRLAYQLTLQFGILVAGMAVPLLLAGQSLGSQNPMPLWASFGLGVLVVLALGAVAQVAAAFHPEKVLLFSLPVLRLLLWILGGFTVPLAALLSRQLKFYEERTRNAGEDREEELSALIDVGQSEGILEREDSELIRGVMEFGDTVAREVMTPRTDMVTAPANSPVKAVAELLARARHTRLPLYEGQIDNIVGVAYLKDFMGALLAGEGHRAVSDFMRPVPFVPENKRISDLLREFQQQKHQLAIVVDEYGGVDGLVTTEDLLEEIVGEIQEHGEAEEAPFKVVAPGVVEALGRASVDDLSELLGVDLPEGDYDSVAGWITTALGTIPPAGQFHTINGLEVEVLAADKRRIHRVRVAVPVQEEPAAPPED